MSAHTKLKEITVAPENLFGGRLFFYTTPNSPITEVRTLTGLLFVATIAWTNRELRSLRKTQDRHTTELSIDIINNLCIILLGYVVTE